MQTERSLEQSQKTIEMGSLLLTPCRLPNKELKDFKKLIEETALYPRTIQKLSEPRYGYTITALKDIPDYEVKAGDIGGFIEDPFGITAQLPIHLWIEKGAFVLDNARIADGVHLGKGSCLSENATIYHAQKPESFNDTMPNLCNLFMSGHAFIDSLDIVIRDNQHHDTRNKQKIVLRKFENVHGDANILSPYDLNAVTFQLPNMRNLLHLLFFPGRDEVKVSFDFAPATVLCVSSRCTPSGIRSSEKLFCGSVSKLYSMLQNTKCVLQGQIENTDGKAIEVLRFVDNEINLSNAFDLALTKNNSDETNVVPTEGSLDALEHFVAEQAKLIEFDINERSSRKLRYRDSIKDMRIADQANECVDEESEDHNIFEIGI